MVDDESHHAGVAILNGTGDQGETGDHVAVDDIVILAAWCIGALAGENAVNIAVKRMWAGTVVFAGRVTFHRGLGDQGAKRAGFFVGGLFPIEAIFAVFAEEMLGVLEYPAAITVHARVFHGFAYTCWTP